MAGLPSRWVCVDGLAAFLRNDSTEEFTAWHEQGSSGNYFICLRVGEKRFRRSLKTNSQEDADSDVCDSLPLRIRVKGQQVEGFAGLARISPGTLFKR